MGMKSGWFRRRPSDDEMREELEAHVAMRAEHDRVDEAAARRRLGNMLHTRESMRRVWIAEWWDALRQDAHFTWRSWRRRPAFALAAILVLATWPRRLDGALRRARPRALQAFAVPGSRSPRLRRADHRPAHRSRARPRIIRQFYVQEWGTPPAPFQSVTAMAVSSRRARPPKNSRSACRAATSSTTFCACWACASRWAATSRPRTTCAGPREVALISHALWVRRFGADPGVVDRTMTLEDAQRIAPAGPHHRRPAARLRDAVRDRRHPASGSPASARPEVPVPHVDARRSHDSGRT